MKKLYSAIIFGSFLPIISYAQNISINTSGAANSTSSMLEVLQGSAASGTSGLFVRHSGSPATAYGLWVEMTGAPTNKYAIVVPAGGGNVGIGTATPAFKLHVYSSDPVTGILSFVNHNPALTANSSQDYISAFNRIDLSSASFNFSSAANAVYGSVNRVNVAAGQTGGTIFLAKGSLSDVNHSGPGTITNAWGAENQVINYSATGTITNATALVANIYNQSTGTITNGYGLSIGTIAATNKWSIYASDVTAPSYFGGNVGIGTATPFGKLHIYGGYATSGLTANAGLYINGVTASPNSAQFVWGDNTGWKVHFGTVSAGNFIERMTIVDQGNVGIGLTSPSWLVDAKKDQNGYTLYGIRNSTTGGSALSGMIVYNDNAPSAGIFGLTSTGWNLGGPYPTLGPNKVFVDANASMNGIVLNTEGAQPVIFATTMLERMRVDGNGNVGIGTTTPSVNLEVSAADQQTAINIINTNSTANRNPRLNIYNYGGAGGFGSPVLEFHNAHGTSAAPTASTVGDAIGNLDFDGYSGSAFVDGALIHGLATENWTPTTTGSCLYFSTLTNGTSGTPVERVRIDHNGNVGIGTSAPGYKLDVTGAIAAGNSDIYFTNTNHNHTGIGNTAGYAAIENAVNYNTLMILGRSGGIGGGRSVSIWDRLDINGTAYVTSGLWSGSDIRYKKDIQPVYSALNNLLKLQGVSYFFKKDEFKDLSFTDGKQYGLIAQELEKVFPEMVSTNEKGYKSVNYIELTPILIEAIKEQQKMIDEQKKAIEKLTEEVEKLKQKK